jgi:lysophospholipase L1-like esterase
MRSTRASQTARASRFATPEIMPDALHPNFKGYQIWAEAISGRVKELMR